MIRARIPPTSPRAPGGVWERLHYDWNSPQVVLTTVDSNVWGGHSGYTYDFTPKPDGKTDVDVVVVREGKNLKGRLLGFVLGTVGKSVLTKAFGVTVKAIEGRNAEAKVGRTRKAPSIRATARAGRYQRSPVVMPRNLGA